MVDIGQVSKPIYKGPAVSLKACRHGAMMYLSRDIYIGRALDLYGEFSDLEVSGLATAVLPGMTVVDLGANVGALTLPFSRMVGPTGSVIAFEPQRAIYNLLCGNLALNDITNVRAIQAGAGSAQGVSAMPTVDYTAPNNFGGLSLDPNQTEPVEVIPLDMLQLAECHLIKADVEGMELEVLRGASDTISRTRPILYLENDRRAKSPDLIREVLRLGYKPYWHAPAFYNPDNFFGNRENHFPGLISVNIFCVPEEMPLKIEGAEVLGPDDSCERLFS